MSDVSSEAAEAVYVTIPEASQRLMLSPSTLWHWIMEGKLNDRNGLRRLGGRTTRIEWEVLKGAIDRGEFA